MWSVLAVCVFFVGSLSFKLEEAWKEAVHHKWDDLNHKIAFNHWKKEFNKKYDNPKDEAYHFLTFLKNWRIINEHNRNGNYNWTMGVNQFTDMTLNEFRYYIHGHGESCRKSSKTTTDNGPVLIDTPRKPIKAVPTSIDWTNINGSSYVTPVKNQGQCGSCWAFSTTGSLEARAAIKNGWTGSQVISLSEQQLVDCSKAEGNAGCNGGLQEDAFKYIGKEGGLCTEAEYPYKGRDGTCKATSCGKLYDTISKTNPYTTVGKDSEVNLRTALADGPVAVSVDAAGTGWQHYKSGVYSGQCGVLLDHGVTGVGYGSSGSQQYWKIKNSWGKTWGMEGYILICRNCNKNGDMGECGILRDNTYPNF